MTSRPISARRTMTTSPPPSKALLELQRKGLEISSPSSSLSLQVPSSGASARSSSSDLDKPLPLEPPDRRRRSSSVYSTDTTITNIIRMYGGFRDLDLDEQSETQSLPQIHQPQAYRDTVAPLLIKRLSLSRTPSPYSKSRHRSQIETSASSLSLRPLAPPRQAPSFMEFSRSLQDRKNELASPVAGSSTDSYRQAALHHLSAPSAQVSSVELSVRVAHTPPLPDAMSGSVSDVTDDDLLPSPPELRSSSPPSPVFDSPAQYDPLHPQAANKWSPGSLTEARYRERHWSENWLEDDLVNQSPTSDMGRLQATKSLKSRQGSAEQGRHRAFSYATSRFSGEEDDNLESRSSARESLQQGVSELLRSVSKSSRAWNGLGALGEGDDVPRERQLAIPANPYQVYGEEIWSKKKKKKPREEKSSPNKRGKSMDLATAYHNGQSQIVNAVNRLTGRTSLRRRKKLKQSIVMVGPMSGSGAVNGTHDRGVSKGDAEWI